MNIWIVSEGEPLPIDGSDVRLRRMGQLCNMLKDRNHEVHWFSSDYHHYKKELRNFDKRDINVADKYFIHLLKGNPYKSNISIQRIKHHKVLSKNFLEKAKEMDRPDIILTTMAPLELSESVIKYADNKVPVIIDIRDLWPEIYKEVLPKWARPLAYPYIYYSKKKLRKTLLNATALISVTEGFLEYGLKIIGLEKRLKDRVFHTSYNRIEYDDSNYNAQWSNIIDKNKFIISFVGNFGKQFELDPVIYAINKLQNYKEIIFVLCGGGSDYNKLYEISKERSNLIVKGWIDGSEIDSLLSNTNIGLAPYKNSINFRLNIPNKFGEYLSYELPILVSVSGDMRKLLEDNVAGFYYQNGDDLTQKILTLYNNRNLAEKMSYQSKILYNTQFNSNIEYLKLVKYLETFIK